MKLLIAKRCVKTILSRHYKFVSVTDVLSKGSFISIVKDKGKRQTSLGQYLPNMTDCMLMKNILGLLIFVNVANSFILKQKTFSGKRINKSSKTKSDNSNN